MNHIILSFHTTPLLNASQKKFESQEECSAALDLETVEEKLKKCVVEQF